jgi:hypothetical protein
MANSRGVRHPALLSAFSSSGIAHCLLNVAATKVFLQGAHVMADIGNDELARVPQHLRRGEGEAGRDADDCHLPGASSCGQFWRDGSLRVGAS